MWGINGPKASDSAELSSSRSSLVINKFITSCKLNWEWVKEKKEEKRQPASAWRFKWHSINLLENKLMPNYLNHTHPFTQLQFYSYIYKSSLQLPTISRKSNVAATPQAIFLERGSDQVKHHLAPSSHVERNPTATLVLFLSLVYSSFSSLKHEKQHVLK